MLSNRESLDEIVGEHDGSECWNRFLRDWVLTVVH